MEEIDYENTEQDELISDEPEQEEDSAIEDSSEESESEDGQEEESQEQENVKPGKIDIRDRLSQVQRERYQALQEAENLRQENEMLRKSAEISATQALKQYDENLTRRYENARIAKARAMEEGDIQTQIDADAELAMVSSEIYQANYLKAQNNIQASQYQNQSSMQYPDNSRHAAQWVQENPWFNASSSEFDPWLAAEVDKACHKYDADLISRGYGHAIMSPAYLNEISQYAESLMSQRNQGGQRLEQRRELNMKQSRTPVSPVRNGYSQSSTKKQDVRLTASEREWAKKLGVKESAYLQQKLRDEKENAHKRIGGR